MRPPSSRRPDPPARPKNQREHRGSSGRGEVARAKRATASPALECISAPAQDPTPSSFTSAHGSVRSPIAVKSFHSRLERGSLRNHFVRFQTVCVPLCIQQDQPPKSSGPWGGGGSGPPSARRSRGRRAPAARVSASPTHCCIFFLLNLRFGVFFGFSEGFNEKHFRCQADFIH